MLKLVNLTIAFLLELVLLAALAYWGWHSSENAIVRVLLAAVPPIVAIVIWSKWLAPRSKTCLAGERYLALKFGLFGIAALALVAAGQVTWALVFIAIAVINDVLLFGVYHEPIGGVVPETSSNSAVQ